MMPMILEFLSYLAPLVVSFLLVKRILISTNKQGPNAKQLLPPGPIALPIIGHLHLLGPFLHQTFRKLSSRYGPLMYLRLGSVGCVVASNPEFAKELLKTYELAFAARMHTAAITHLTYNSSFAFAPYGTYWKFIRKFSTYELLGNRTLAQFLPVRTKELHHLLQFVLDKAKAGESVNLTQELLKLTNNTISQMMLSMRCSGTGNPADSVRTLVREVTEIFGEFNISDSIWFLKNWDLQGFRKRFEDLHRRFDALLEMIMRERERVRSESKQKKGDNVNKVKDFLDIMLDVLEKDNSESEVDFTRNHIKALILDFFTAATDTTAIVLEWAMAELINHPKLLKIAQQEIDQVVGKGRLVEESDSPHLHYIQAIIKETFRLHPPVPMINRKSIQTCQVKGYTIPAECMVFVNVWAIGRDPKVWTDPLKFQPERFLKSDDSIDVRGQHYELLPFGSGRRGCPGASLALQELPTTLAAMIQCFDWKVANGVVDMVERPGLTAPRAKDLECVPVVRFTPTLFAT
uniref:Flavonoid 2-hydroxylase n=1 Tax=Microcos paniculata TaxID=197124 RepID=A0A1V0CM45_9ROSI|nr:flavonoid 2-hydroxylase [Microcos paniculata]